MTSLYALIEARCPPVYRRINWNDADCPLCGRKSRRHGGFGYGPNGFNCFWCGAKGSLADLAKELKLDTGGVVHIYTPPAPMPEERYAWQDNADDLAEQYAAHRDTVALWRGYKRLSEATIRRHGLGVGVLPECQCKHQRLIYPLKIDGRVVGLRGRAYLPLCKEHCQPWLSARGTKAQLWGRDLLMAATTPQRVVLLENAIDAMWLMERHPQYLALAGSAGAGTWKPEWTDALAMARVLAVVVAYDADMAGCPTSSQIQASRVERGAALGCDPSSVHLQQPGGWRVRDALLAAGIRATCIVWPEGTPKGYDIGRLLSESGAVIL